MTQLSTIVYSETPVREIWSRLSYFESEHNSMEFLDKFGLPDDDLTQTSRSLAFTMRTAREYYESAEHVSLLTQPLLIFYGMSALSKVLFTSTYGKRSPSTSHGLKPPEPAVFPNISTKVRKDGTFPQFHSCYGKDKLFRMRFTMKELLSLIPEIREEYRGIYKEESRALGVLRKSGSVIIHDQEKKYPNLATDLKRFFPEITAAQVIPMGVSVLFSDIPTVRAISGQEYFILPLQKHNKNVLLPEMSTHYMVMYLLGMLSRYYPKEWGEITKGEESGDIYAIQKFLKTTTRKFPNLILNELHNRDFVFLGPQFEREKRLSREQLDEIFRYVNRELGERIARRL